MATLKTAQPARHPNPTTKAQRLAYLIFEGPDLEKTERFLQSFGLVTGDHIDNAIYMRGANELPFCYMVKHANKDKFLGFAFEMASKDDLITLSRIPGASGIEPLTTPGGGDVVRLRCPSGFLVEAVYGQQAYSKIEQREALTMNNAGSPERINSTQRPPIEPPQITKLGHVVIEAPKYQQTSEWYTKHFGLIPSDVQVLPDGSPMVTFFRLDLGDTPADHHTLAMGQGFSCQYNHSAFEVMDQDALGMGQRVLREKGYSHAWGIGRHVLGSQIFDYWDDPRGYKHEHYCDGDLFTSNIPTGVTYASKESLSQWGAPVPSSFVKPKVNAKIIMDLVKNLMRSPDLTIGKLLTMARTML